MAHKALGIALVSVGLFVLALPLPAGEKTAGKQTAAESASRELANRPEVLSWARGDVSRGVVTFRRGGKNAPLFIWVRGGSKAVVTFRRGGKYDPLFTFHHGGNYDPLFNFVRGGSRTRGCFDFRR